jgi:hypothetical protein
VASGCAQKAPVQSFAELPDRIRPGHAVYVTDEQGEQTRGRLHEVSRAALTMSGADGIMRFPADRITAIDRSGDPLWNGLAIGLGFGTAMALFADQREVPCADWAPSPPSERSVWASTRSFGAARRCIGLLTSGRPAHWSSLRQRPLEERP